MDTSQSNLNKFAKAAENAINSALTMDASSQKHLKRLYGCIFALNITSTNNTFFFGVKECIENTSSELEGSLQYQVELLPAQDNSTVQLSGSILSLIKLAASKDKAILFRSKELELSGDSVRIQQIQGFLDSINIDWEAILATFIGDVPAHFFGSTIRSSIAWSLTFTQSVIRDAEEYIKYELKLFPSKARAQKQFAAIDELYKATEQLETKFKKAISNVNKTKSENQASAS